MTPRQLEAAILADAECVPHVRRSFPKVAAAEAIENDRAIADILNGKGVGAASRSVPCHLAKKLLVKRGRWLGIVEAANNPLHAARDAAYAAVALAEDARMDADFLDPAAGPLLAALVATSLITADDRAALEALCHVSSAITIAEVSRALRGPWE